LQELINYLDYLLFVQQKQSGAIGKAENEPAVEVKPETEKQVEEDIPERLRIARQFARDAPHPHFPTFKYDVKAACQGEGILLLQTVTDFEGFRSSLG